MGISVKMHALDVMNTEVKWLHTFRMSKFTYPINFRPAFRALQLLSITYRPH